MNGGATNSVGVLNEDTVDEFVVEETLAIYELIEHPGGNGLER